MKSDYKRSFNNVSPMLVVKKESSESKDGRVIELEGKVKDL